MHESSEINDSNNMGFLLLFLPQIEKLRYIKRERDRQTERQRQRGRERETDREKSGLCERSDERNSDIYKKTILSVPTTAVSELLSAHIGER